MTPTKQAPRNVRTGCDALLAEAATQIAAVRALYESTLAAKAVPPTLQTKIKCALDNQRSPLDYLAHFITERDGKQGARTYFPCALTTTEFPNRFDQNMPGVAAVRPDIMQAIENHQPFPGKPQWLGALGRSDEREQAPAAHPADEG